MHAIGAFWHDGRLSGGFCPIRSVTKELHSAAERFIAEMRIRDLRVRIVRDGHEPNEAEEQRPRCVPIDPVHVVPRLRSSTCLAFPWALVPGLLPPSSGQLVRRERWIMTRLNLIGSCSNARGRCLDVNCLLYDFSMQREVEALAFDFGRGTKTNDQIDQL